MIWELFITNSSFCFVPLLTFSSDSGKIMIT
nr:MAG TPA: hypothetical protein [Caudoviricetes sp.]